MPGRRPTWRRPSGQGASPQQRRLCRTRLPRSKRRVVGLVPHSGTEVNNARPFRTYLAPPFALAAAGAVEGRYLGSVVREYRWVLFMRAFANIKPVTRIKNRRFDCRRYGFGLIAVKDRKSTRLNSSHVKISYAVFCLKKKKRIIHQ